MSYVWCLFKLCHRSQAFEAWSRMVYWLLESTQARLQSNRKACNSREPNTFIMRPIPCVVFARFSPEHAASAIFCDAEPIERRFVFQLEWFLPWIKPFFAKKSTIFSIFNCQNWQSPFCYFHKVNVSTALIGWLKECQGLVHIWAIPNKGTKQCHYYIKN